VYRSCKPRQASDFSVESIGDYALSSDQGANSDAYSWAYTNLLSVVSVKHIEIGQHSHISDQ